MGSNVSGFNPYQCKTCAVCNAEFWGYRKNGEFCSNACRQKRYRENKERKEEAKKSQLVIPGFE